jgi:hypothetical protein
MKSLSIVALTIGFIAASARAVLPVQTTFTVSFRLGGGGMNGLAAARRNRALG